MFEDSTHGGRHQLRYTEFQDIFISTHALTEGDIGSHRFSDHCNISTHALTEGDRILQCCDLMQGISTHALTEGDFRHDHMHDLIHIFQLTPSRRATPSRVSPWYWMIFQLTPSRRATTSSNVCSDYCRHFNSRPHGGRPRRWNLRIWISHFNSRPHGGRQGG